MRTYLVKVDALGAHVHALNDNRAARGMLQTIDAAKHRRLARARGAQDHNDLTLVNIQIDIAQDHVVAKGLLEVLDTDDDLVRVIGFAHDRTSLQTGDVIGRRRDNLSGALGGTLLLGLGRAQKPRLKTAHQASERQGDDQIEQGGNHIRRDGARRGHMVRAFMTISTTPTAASSDVSL